MALDATPESKLSADELIQLAAVDSDFFGHTFFPKVFRQESPPFHRDLWNLLEGSNQRFVQALCFRGSAKTTLARTYTLKRIAYGASKTILYLSASERHAVSSLQFMRAQIERNELFSKVYGLRPGQKWQENEFSVFSEILGEPVWVLGAGATGSVRGINFDSYRPDLIVIDDLQSDESAASKELRDKAIELLYGSLIYSLAPQVESPNSKMVILATPINPEDVTQKVQSDPAWRTVVFPCWTPETLDAPLHLQESAWPSLYPSETLRQEKQMAIDGNALTRFVRERECRIVSAETSSFKAQWVKTFGDPDADEPLEPESGITVITVDPVPPPSERQIAKGLTDKDFEVIMVVRRSMGRFYVLEYAMQRGHEPNWTINKVFELARRYKVARVVVEAIGYQRTIATALERAMKVAGMYWPVVPKNDKRKKFNRILSALSGPLSNGKVFIRPAHSELRQQILLYPSTKFDDCIDALSMAVDDLQSPHLEMAEGSDYTFLDESNIPDLEPIRRCP
jgi:predicted phage terminase large subunit-like protein